MVIDELLRQLATGNPTIADLQAAVDLLKAQRFTRVSAKLFRLADLLRR
jgi:hypothetical protein